MGVSKMIFEASKKAIFLLASLCICFCSIEPTVSLNKNIDRPGSDYASLDLESADPILCADACERDPECQAFSYNPPGMSGTKAKCWLKNEVPDMVNATGVISGVKEESKITSPIPLNNNVDRPGSDYASLDLASADPILCADACEKDPECQAFSYNPPGMSGPKAKCWLKNEVPEAFDANGVVSGVKGGSTVSTYNPVIPFDNNIDRPGSDYASLDLASADPKLCADACEKDPECQAFSYNPPGMSGPRAKCWLKNGVPEAFEADGVVSGVK